MSNGPTEPLSVRAINKLREIEDELERLSILLPAADPNAGLDALLEAILKGETPEQKELRLALGLSGDTVTLFLHVTSKEPTGARARSDMVQRIHECLWRLQFTVEYIDRDWARSAYDRCKALGSILSPELSAKQPSLAQIVKALKSGETSPYQESGPDATLFAVLRAFPHAHSDIPEESTDPDTQDALNYLLERIKRGIKSESEFDDVSNAWWAMRTGICLGDNRFLECLPDFLKTFADPVVPPEEKVKRAYVPESYGLPRIASYMLSNAEAMIKRGQLDAQSVDRLNKVIADLAERLIDTPVRRHVFIASVHHEGLRNYRDYFVRLLHKDSGAAKAIVHKTNDQRIPSAQGHINGGQLARALRLLLRKWTLIGIAGLMLALLAWRGYEKYLGCGAETTVAIPHKSGRETAHYVRNNKNERVVVFVHGIFGDAEETWAAAPNAYWPDLVVADPTFSNADVYVAAYPTGLGNRFTIDEIVGNVFEQFVKARIFDDHSQVIFVCHSLGGLVTQRLLLKHRELAAQVALIYFYGTPQTGAEIARLGQMFSGDPLLAQMSSGSENFGLAEMESDWRAASFGNISRKCAYEKLDYRCIRIVDERSATRGCDNGAVALRRNHVTIVKPKDMDDDIHGLLQNAWLKLPAVAPRSSAIDVSTPTRFSERLAVRGFVDDLCGRGALHNPANWELTAEVHQSISAIKLKAEGLASQLPDGASARGEVLRIRDASRIVLQDPRAFPRGAEPLARPVSGPLFSAILEFRATIANALSKIKASYGFDDVCTVGSNAPSAAIPQVSLRVQADGVLWSAADSAHVIRPNAEGPILDRVRAFKGNSSIAQAAVVLHVSAQGIAGITGLSYDYDSNPLPLDAPVFAATVASGVPQVDLPVVGGQFDVLKWSIGTATNALSLNRPSGSVGGNMPNGYGKNLFLLISDAAGRVLRAKVAGVNAKPNSCEAHLEFPPAGQFNLILDASPIR